MEAEISSTGFWQSYLNMDLKCGDSVKHTRARLFNAISPDGKNNKYAFYAAIPADMKCDSFKLYITDPFIFDGDVHKLSVTEFDK